MAAVTRRTRWERERSAWLVSRARLASTRRRGEVMARRARRLERDAAGVGADPGHTAVTPWAGRRWIGHDSAAESSARFLLLAGLLLVALLTIAEAVVIAVAAYAIGWWLSPWLGRLRAWPYIAAAVAVLVVGWTVGGIQETWRFWNPDERPVPVEGVWLSRAWVEVTAGLLLAGWHVRRAGWAAVPKGQRRRSRSAAAPQEDSGLVLPGRGGAQR